MEREDERGPDAGAAAGPGGLPEAEVERLADRVYRLMLAEVRLARARGQQRPSGGGE